MCRDFILPTIAQDAAPAFTLIIFDNYGVRGWADSNTASLPSFQETCCNFILLTIAQDAADEYAYAYPTIADGS